MHPWPLVLTCSIHSWLARWKFLTVVRNLWTLSTNVFWVRWWHLQFKKFTGIYRYMFFSSEYFKRPTCCLHQMFASFDYLQQSVSHFGRLHNVWHRARRGSKKQEEETSLINHPYNLRLSRKQMCVAISISATISGAVISSICTALALKRFFWSELLFFAAS